MSQLKLRKILKIAVEAYWLIIIICTFAARDITWVSEADVGKVLLRLLDFWIVAIIISTIGLYFIQPWAKWSFTIFVAIDPILTYLTGPLSVHKSDFANVITIVMGSLHIIDIFVILYLLFFTNVMPKKKHVPSIE